MEQGRKGSDKIILLNSLWLKTVLIYYFPVDFSSKLIVSASIRARIEFKKALIRFTQCINHRTLVLF